MPAPYQPHDLYLAQRGLKPCTLGGYTFWINPQQFKMVTERIVQAVPTRAGVGRFSYGLKQITYELMGFTGSGGVEDLTDSQHGMALFRPSFGQNLADTPVRFQFPYRRINRPKVYIDYMEDGMDSGSLGPLYVSYDIRLSEYPPPVAPYVPISGAPISGKAQGL